MNLAERSRMIRDRRHHASRTEHVRVLDIAACLVHPMVAEKFPPTGGAVEWPLDAFTLRRLRDGDITIEGGVPVQPARPRPSVPVSAARPVVPPAQPVAAPASPQPVAAPPRQMVPPLRPAAPPPVRPLPRPQRPQ